MMGTYALLRLLFGRAQHDSRYQRLFEEERDRIAATSRDEEERALLITKCVQNKQQFIEQKEAELGVWETLGSFIGFLLFVTFLILLARWAGVFDPEFWRV